MYNRRSIEDRNSKHLSKPCGSWQQTKNKKQIPPTNVKQIDMPPLDVIQVPAVSLGSDSQTTENGNFEHLSNSRDSRQQIKNKKVNCKEKKNIGTGGGPPSDHDSDPSDADESSSPTKNSKRSKKKKAKKKKKKNESSVDPNKNSSNESSTDDNDPLGYKQTLKQIKFEPDKFPKLTPSGNYDKWERKMLVVAKMQQLYNVVDLEAPDKKNFLKGDKYEAYKVRMIQIYFVFMQTIDTIEHGARLLRTQFQSMNACKIYVGLRKYYVFSYRTIYKDYTHRGA